MEEPKIIQFSSDESRYRKIAEAYAEKGDFSKALGFLLTAKSLSPSLEIITDIADCYADMGLMELSNKYWFLYLDKAPKEKVSLAYEELAINFFLYGQLFGVGLLFSFKINY